MWSKYILSLALFASVIILFGCAAQYCKWYKPDNIIEEMVEEIIEIKTGVDVDLSIGTPE